MSLEPARARPRAAASRRSLLDDLPAIVWTSDADGRFSRLNARARERLAASNRPAERWLDGIHDDDLDRCRRTFAEARDLRRPFRLSYRRIGADGSAWWALDQASPRLASAGRFGGFTGVCVEACPQEDAGSRQAAGDRAMRQAERELEAVARAASHDLKEPLSIVAVYSELLRKRHGGKLDEEADRFVRYSVDAVHRMHALLNDLVAYLRIPRIGTRLPDPVDAGAVLQSVLFDLKPSLERAGAILTREPLPALRAEEGHLRQVFWSLLDNALKFRGVEPPRVHVGCTRTSAEAVVSVSDNGIGIDPRHAPRIFGVFQRLHGYEYEGTGMGLALAGKIVELYGGRIWVESEAGRGATFRFTLPAGETPPR
ncbi:MAG TPA: ATP-binding protein [Candidatus Polarisedimenticolia bacterium]|nr:ATP-binding protein [Candidatus Polarisedimenticolia bacterium]